MNEATRLGATGWPCGAAHVPRGRPRDTTPRSCGTHLRREPASEAIEIRQREGREEPHGVLGEAAIADLREAPQPFDHMKGVLAAGARLGPPAILGALADRQRPLLRAAAVDTVAHAVGHGTLPVKLAPVRLVAVKHPL